MIIIVNEFNEIFDIAVITRFIHYSTGFKDIKLILRTSRLRKKDIISLIRYSRVPVEKFKSNVKVVSNFQDVLEILKNFDKIFIVQPDEAAVHISKVNSCNLLVLDLSKDKELYKLLQEKLPNKIIKVYSIKSNMLHYETIAILYELLLRRRISIPEIPEHYVPNEVLSGIFYLSNKILEGIENISNFYIINPRVLIYTLRNIFQQHGYLIDAIETNIKFDHLNGIQYQEIKFKVFDKNLNEINVITCELIGNKLKIIIPTKSGKFIDITMFIDFEHKRIILSKNLVIEKKILSDEDLAQILSKMF